MIGQAIRSYRFRNKLSQQDLAKATLLNQKIISRLELGQPDAIDRYNSQSERFSLLRSLIEKASESDPIQLYRGSIVPLGQTGNDWTAVVPPSMVEECYRLFAGLDIAIVVQDFQEVQSVES